MNALNATEHLKMFKMVSVMYILPQYKKFFKGKSNFLKKKLTNRLNKTVRVVNLSQFMVP